MTDYPVVDPVFGMRSRFWRTQDETGEVQHVQTLLEDGGGVTPHIHPSMEERFTVQAGRMEAVAYPQGKVFEAAVQFARTHGTIPAPETAHAIRAAVDEALLAKEEGVERVILFSYSGHGLLDLSAYDDFLNDRLDG